MLDEFETRIDGERCLPRNHCPTQPPDLSNTDFSSMVTIRQPFTVLDRHINWRVPFE